MDGSPAVRVCDEGVRAVLEEEAEGFEFAGGGGVVQGGVAGSVDCGEDAGVLEDQGGDQVEGAATGFAGEHKLWLLV